MNKIFDYSCFMQRYLIPNRTFEDIYKRLEEANSMQEIRNLTGCGKPCHYTQYKLVEKLKRFSQPYYVGSCPIAVWVASPDTSVEKEELIYPLTSLVTEFLTLLMSPLHSQVAEFGGTLSLFLGFSFMTIWDWGQVVGERIKGLKRALHVKAQGNNEELTEKESIL